MAESRAHEATAKRISHKYNTKYNKGKGADVRTNNIAIEVETPQTVSEASRQLRGYKKPVYIAGTNQQAVNKALEATERTTIGVMDSKGNVMRRSTRKKC